MKDMSLGNRKKAQLAYVLALGVDVLLLDEPTNALDIESKETLKRIIASSIEDHQTIIVSTHTVSELENLFDGTIMLRRSRLLLAASAEAVTERLAFTVSRLQDPEALYSEIQAGRVLNISAADGDEDTRQLASALFGVTFARQFKNHQPTSQTMTATAHNTNQDRFSWRRVGELYAYNKPYIRRQLLAYGACSIFFAILTLLPIAELGQVALFSMIWTVVPLLGELAPLVFAKSGDARIVDRLIPASPVEKYVFYMTYLLIVVQAVVWLIPTGALWLYTKIPAIRNDEVTSSIELRYSTPGSIALMNILTTVAAILTCFYVEMRCQSNRVLKAVVSVFVVQFAVGLLGVFYGLGLVFRTGFEDGRAGTTPNPDAIVQDFMHDMSWSSPYVIMVICILAAYTALMFVLSYKVINRRNL